MLEFAGDNNGIAFSKFEVKLLESISFEKETVKS